MINFKEELIEVLENNGLTVEDIFWVGTRKYRIDLDLFLENIDFEYDNGYGITEIPMDLVIVGDNWWLERAEYDGSEWWAFKQMIYRPREERQYTNFQSKRYDYLEDINK